MNHKRFDTKTHSRSKSAQLCANISVWWAAQYVLTTNLSNLLSLSRSRMHSTVTIDWYECFHLYEQQDTRLNHFMVPDLLIQPPIASTYSDWNKWNCFTSAPLHGLLCYTLVVYIENKIWWLSVDSSKRILVYVFKRSMALLIHRVLINFTMQRIFTNRGVLLP